MTSIHFSAGKLIEYAFASPQRRNSIIENALTPPKFILDTKYKPIELANSHYLASKCSDKKRLLDLDQTYVNQPALTDHQETRLLNAHEAIECTLEMNWEIPTNSTVVLANKLPEIFEISGLNIKVRPNIVIKRQKLGSITPDIGVGKSYFSKTFPLNSYENNEPANLFGVLLHWYAEQKLNFLGTAMPELCLIGDVFSKSAYSAPKRFKQRRKQIAALAQEITDRIEPIRMRLESIEVASKKAK